MKRTLIGGLSAVVLVGGLTAANQLTADATPQAVAAHTSTTIGCGLGLDLSAVKPARTTSTTVVAMAAVRPMAAAPESADLSSRATAPGNQGRVGSCVAWATGYTGYGTLMNWQRISGGPMAPMFIYSQIAQGDDQGTSASVALPMLQQQGIDTKADHTQGDEDYTRQPTAQERANAARFKLAGHEELTTRGEAAKQAIMGAVASGSPVPIGMQLHSNFNDMDAQTAASYSHQPAPDVIGGHEITIVGGSPSPAPRPCRR